jgi:hypothetical protein
LLIFLAVGSWIYSILTPEPTCFDGQKNQNEEKIDCGGICQKKCKKEIILEDLEISEKHFVPARKNEFDVMAKIKNTNSRYGASNFRYKFTLLDSAGNALQERSGESYILPGETKYLIETNLSLNNTPDKIEVEISDYNWQEFVGYEEPKLIIYDDKFMAYNERFANSRVTGLLKNESNFDFNSIIIDIILRDDQGKPLALAESEMRTIPSREERDFNIIWPYLFSAAVANIEIRAEANVFDSLNFMEEYSTNQRFQQLK